MIIAIQTYLVDRRSRRGFIITWIPAKVQVSVGGGRPLGPLQLAVNDSFSPITFPLGVMNDDVMNGLPLGGSNFEAKIWL